jgi:tetratricopeptide (TPR) repeat protein
MTSKLLLAGLTAGLLLGASATTMAADAPKPPKITSGVAKNLQAAQTANNKKDFPAALAAIEEAKKVSDRTPYDDLMIDRFSMSIHIGMQDMAAADVDAEAAAEIDPTQIPDADKAAVYGPAMKLALNTKHYDKAAKYAKLYQATNPPAADMAVITQALYLGGDYAAATALAQKNIDAATAAGQKPNRNDLDVVMAAQVKQKDEVGAEKTLETLVATYNTPDDWKQLMEVSLTTKGMRDIDYVYMGRLMFLQGAPISQPDASLIGSTASKAGLYGDALQAEKAGGTGFPPAGPKADTDKKTFAQQIAAGAKQNGVYNVKTGEAAYGYGMYSDAETLAQAAKTKGGLQDPTEADMLIGMSQAAQGKYAEAAQTFGAINQPNPAAARVVRLWTYFAKQKANPGTGATAAAK